MPLARDLVELETTLRAHLTARLAVAGACDPAHDILHLERVVASAKKICAAEGADPAIVIPAAWLHDYVVVAKDDPLRNQASRLAAQAARAYLLSIGYPPAAANPHAPAVPNSPRRDAKAMLVAIAHAIEAHSFSANIAPQTLEAKVVQDADRLDGIGAIGIARCFACSGTMNRPFYSAVDPFCAHREPDDGLFTVDHFYRKLFKTAATMQTAAGRAEAERRVEVMRGYLAELGAELGE
ncbi:MAG: HD domain-containing protein [Humidesulfovibrio sp.]|uniref:HD domain-containing protein n=1 Tax=Humidesulfovibrio sp. TaxID=2910988 RepID=UPI0027EE29BD|nr:HD domain-containing protein [Humidesulfovibrio sp.]MDQ7835085.1 HD domain-containing protein [Humidesulfovibrio sp.]